MLELIGQTPMVRLTRTGGEVAATIYAKLEWYGPTGSLKDRIYRRMVARAEESGDLRRGMTILECSTGNAGIACAFVAALRGYPCVIVMPEGMSVERQKLMLAYGAELVLTPGGESDVDLALERLEEIRGAAPGRYWVPGQFDNAENSATHYAETGPEIWEQTGGDVDAFVASQGSGGTLTGVGRYLRERRPDVRLYAVEPVECPILTDGRWGSHGIEGIGDGFVPRNLDLSILTGVVTVSTEEALVMARRLARDEGIFCGISSGCNMAAALTVSRAHPELRALVIMINDTGQRYFTTALCGEGWKATGARTRRALDPATVEALSRYQRGLEFLPARAPLGV